MKLRIEIDMSDEALEDRIEVVANAHYDWWRNFQRTPIGGITMWSVWSEDKEDPSKYRKHLLRPAVLQRGLDKLIADERFTVASAVLNDDYVAHEVDLWLQYAIYGEEVFG